MTEEHRKPGIAFWAIVVLAVAIIPSAIYLGTYAWIVEPTPVAIFPSMGGEHHFVVPKYDRLGEALFWRTFFGPANQLDRCVRPDVWQQE